MLGFNTIKDDIDLKRNRNINFVIIGFNTIKDDIDLKHKIVFVVGTTVLIPSKMT